MSFWKISKDFAFCYGHRVWSQELLSEFAETSHCKCRHLHGHEASVTVSLSGSMLVKDMVTDFNHLTWLKTFLDKYLDHKFILDSNDPLYSSLTQQAVTIPVTINNLAVGSQIVVPSTLSFNAQREYLESFFIVDFVPTSERLSQWLYKVVATKMEPLKVKVEEITWWESPKSRATYSAGD